MYRLPGLLLALLCITPLAHSDSTVLRLGSTTSVKASGLLAAIKPRFEKDTGYRLQAFATGSGKAMKLARDGEFDILIVHAPASEKNLIADGYAVKRIPFMKNYFLLAGPAADPAKIKGLTDVHEALRRIAGSKSLFISRADDSGTHKMEIALWKAAGIDPVGSWYFESGLGMSAALALANEKSAYTLVDDGTWLAKKDSLTLVTLAEDHQRLENTYSIVMLNRKVLKNVNERAASAFANWLLSGSGENIIRGMVVNGEPLFTLVNR